MAEEEVVEPSAVSEPAEGNAPDSEPPAAAATATPRESRRRGTRLATWARRPTVRQLGHELTTVDSNGTIVGGNSGLCLSVTGASTAADAAADLYTCDGGASENRTVG